jgi:CAAX protease family protein
MSGIPFLDNAADGKNNWWRYLLTIALSLLLGSLVAGFILAVALIVYSIFLAVRGVPDVFGIISAAVSNPFFLLIMIGVSYALSFILFYICLRFLHHKRLLSIINAISMFRWKLLLKGLGLWFLILFLFSLPDLIWNTSSYNVTFDPKSFLILLVLCILVFPLQASFEEIFFRGYLMQGVGLLSKRPWIPLLVTSLVFGLVHFFNGTDLNMDVSIVISTFIIGMMLGIIALGDNGIEAAMGVHIANNLYVSLIYNSTDSGLSGLPSIITSQVSNPYAGIPILALAALIIIIILFWNRKDDLMRIFVKEKLI